MDAKDDRRELIARVFEMEDSHRGIEFDWSIFIEQHQADNAFYKIGTVVRYIGDIIPLYQGREMKVLASNVQDGESTEYCLEGFPYLVWGDEIQPVEVRPEDCQCLDSTFEALGCMCQKRTPLHMIG